MINTKSENRIVFIDLMRAFAVLMMVQGHTIDALLANEYRTFDSLFYNIWNSMRGFTAPIFMFSSGTVFTYLLMSKKLPFNHNPRIWKGIKRFLLLVSLGYFLRFPTSNIFDFSNISENQWNVFFVVDALHLIGFGLLSIIVLEFISEKFRLKNYYTFGLFAAIIFFTAPIITSMNWDEYLPRFFSAYFFYKHGSLFPLFPWLGFVIFGGVFGNYLANNKDVFRNIKFVHNIIAVGLIFIVVGFLVHYARVYLIKPLSFWTDQTALSFYRLGVVLLLNSIMAFIAIKTQNVPSFFRITGKHTLSIYVTHLIIIYGSAWIPGLLVSFGQTLNSFQAISLAAGMIVAMVFLALGIDKYLPLINDKMQMMFREKNEKFENN
ncbi:MAG: hypothetical protein Fur0015_13820 [Ignavibacteriales bacterium]